MILFNWKRNQFRFLYIKYTPIWAKIQFIKLFSLGLLAFGTESESCRTGKQLEIVGGDGGLENLLLLLFLNETKFLVVVELDDNDDIEHGDDEPDSSGWVWVNEVFGSRLGGTAFNFKSLFLDKLALLLLFLLYYIYIFYTNRMNI